MRWIKYLAPTLALVGAASLVKGDAWSTSGSQPTNTSLGASWEQAPDGNDSPGKIDDYIRDLKWEIRRRLEVEMDFGPVSGDSGVMREGSARTFFVTTDTSAVDEMSDQDDSANDSPGPYVPSTQTNSSDALNVAPAGWTNQLGVGRLLISRDGPTAQVADPTSATDDDGKLYFHNGTTWVEAKSQHDDATELSRQKSGAGNQVRCGSFECMDAGSGGPPTLYGWAAFNTPTTSQAVAATGANDEGLMYRIVGNDAVNKEGIQFTLSGLRPATNYAVRARAFATAAGDVCTLRVTGGTTSPVDSSTTGNGVWESLNSIVTTDGTPTNLVVILGAGPTAGSDQCDFDRVAIYEESLFNYPNMQPVTKYVQNTTPVTLTGAYQTLASLSVVPPTDNYNIIARGNVCVGLDTLATTAFVRVRLFDGAAALIVTSGGVSTGAGAGDGYTTIPIEYINLNPTSGTTYTFNLQALEHASDTVANEDANCTSSLTVELAPQ